MANDKSRSIVVGVSLPEDLIDDLDMRAEKESRSRSNLIAVLCREALDAETPA